MKKRIIAYVLFISLIMSLPAFVTFLFGMPDENETIISDTNDILNGDTDTDNILTVEKTIIAVNPETMEKSEIAFEQYIVGVVAAEMPASFEPEALKAQAVAARTYAYRRLSENGAMTDEITEEMVSGIYQAYLTREELKQKWGGKYDEYYAKISAAVSATEGEIMVYGEEPIEAVFHSTSAGMTERAGNVWQTDYPYLLSVASEGDAESPEYTSQKTFTDGELKALLRENIEGLYLTDGSIFNQFQIVSITGAGYVENVLVGGKTVTGRQIREALGLKSGAFTVSQNGGNITFTTKGYGHGVGMSQYGANSMAENGFSYKDILSHYYTGVAFFKQNGAAYSGSV